jgi:hypothetical protein
MAQAMSTARKIKAGRIRPFPDPAVFRLIIRFMPLMRDIIIFPGKKVKSENEISAIDL